MVAEGGADEGGGFVGGFFGHSGEVPPHFFAAMAEVGDADAVAGGLQAAGGVVGGVLDGGVEDVGQHLFVGAHGPGRLLHQDLEIHYSSSGS